MRALTYLQKHPHTGVYRVRRIIPAAARHAFGGRREFLRSLRTRSLRDARSRAMPLLAELQTRIDEVLGGAATDETGHAAARETRLFHDGARHGAREPWDDRQQHRGVKREPNGDEQALANDGLETQDQTDPDGSSHGGEDGRGDGAGDGLHHGHEDGAANGLAHGADQRPVHGDTHGLTHDQVQQTECPVLAGGCATGAAKPPIRTSRSWSVHLSTDMHLMDLCDALLAAKRYRPKTVRDVRRAFELLVELHGNLPVRSVKRGHIRELRDALLRYPVSGRNARVQGMSIRRVIEREWTHTISPVTVEKLLGFVSKGFQLGVSEGWCEQNPREGILVGQSPTAVHTERADFRPHQLRTLFGSPLFTSCRSARFVAERGDVEVRDFRYWLPWVALYTGARLGELCQLEKGDLRTQEGTWYLEITDVSGTKGGAKSLKTKHSRRVVPVHQRLLDLGFLQYANTTPGPYIFASHYPTPHKLSHEVSKWFGRYLTAVGLDDRCAAAWKSSPRERGIGAEN